LTLYIIPAVYSFVSKEAVPEVEPRMSAPIAGVAAQTTQA
jgi:hypothetical protein